LWKATGNSEPFKVSKGACHRARVQGAYVYTVFENLTYGSSQPYIYDVIRYFWLEITKYAVYVNIYTRFWPTLLVRCTPVWTAICEASLSNAYNLTRYRLIANCAMHFKSKGKIEILRRQQKERSHFGNGYCKTPPPQRIFITQAFRQNLKVWRQDRSLHIQSCPPTLHTAQVNQTLTTLRLTHNNIPDEGICALADILVKKNMNVTEVDVSGNRLGANGAKALSCVLGTRGSTLKTVSVTCLVTRSVSTT